MQATLNAVLLALPSYYSLVGVEVLRTFSQHQSVQFSLDGLLAHLLPQTKL